MWYISKIEVLSSGGVILDRPSFVCRPGSHYPANGFRLTVTNNETGESFNTNFDMCQTDVHNMLNPLSVYGYVPWFQKSMYVVLDSLSLKFLEYVDSVVMLNSMTHEESMHVSCLRNWVKPWDSLCTLLNINGSGEGFPIFQVICFLGDSGWMGDRYLMRSAGLNHKTVACCVNFSDIDRARAFIVKALLSGYNPMQDILDKRLKGL